MRDSGSTDQFTVMSRDTVCRRRADQDRGSFGWLRDVGWDGPRTSFPSVARRQTDGLITGHRDGRPDTGKGFSVG